MSASAPPSPASDTAAACLKWVSLALMLGCITARALVVTSELPYWDLDPLRFVVPMTGIGPAGSMWFDTAIIGGAALALLGVGLARERVHGWMLLAAGAGIVPALWHGFLTHGPALQDQRIGMAWVAAICSGVAVAHLCRDERLRRVTAAVLLGVVAALAVRGLQQWFIEHPATVADFRRNRRQILEGHGWAESSASALSYERRLLQREATGWFALANVYATLAATAAVAFTGLVALTWRTAPGHRSVLLVLAGLAGSLLGVVLAGSKGGYAGLLAGLAVLVLLVAVCGRSGSGPPSGRSRLRRLVPCIAVFAFLAPLAGLITRGQFAGWTGEKSLLFRWFYLEAAAKIVWEHLPLGVGPDGFQGAYLLAKPPLSPEDVRSPHAIMLDWVATLGIGGLAWCGLAVWWLWSGLRRAAESSDSGAIHANNSGRAEWRFIGLVVAGATIACVAIDRMLLTPDMAAVRIVMMGLWIAVAVGVALRSAEKALAVSLAAAGVTLGLLIQIDVAASWPASCALVTAVLASSAMSWRHRVAPARPAGGIVAAVIMLVLAGFVAVHGALPATHWTSHLRTAARFVAPATEFSQRWDEAAAKTSPADRDAALRALAADVAALTGSPMATDAQSLRLALDSVYTKSLADAFDELLAAGAIEPGEWRTRREASRLAIAIAARLVQVGDAREGALWLEKAVRVATPEDAATARTAMLTWLAVVLETAHDLNHLDQARERAAAALESALARDPYNLEAANRLAHVYDRLGDNAKRGSWARRALELDGQTVLDPGIRGLRENDRTDLRRWAAEP
ncbi:MAG: O-antigen ligase family protein [Phycisphaeraceae bacterium]|nr:O-antigen ligase family protein [Phycisphaeraceae bacterium]